MRQDLSLVAAAWLASGPIVVRDVASVLATFKPGTARVVRFSGPHTLYPTQLW